MTVRVSDRLPHSGVSADRSIQKKDGLSIGTAQLHCQKVSNRSRIEVLQSAMGRDRKRDLTYGLKLSREFYEGRWVEAINVQNSLSRRLGGLRSAGEQKSDQEGVNSEQSTVGSHR
jgi:hypothetical protein